MNEVEPVPQVIEHGRLVLPSNVVMNGHKR
jgi:hypothetical protein